MKMINFLDLRMKFMNKEDVFLLKSDGMNLNGGCR